MTVSNRQVRTQVRMPEGVHKWLAARAAKHTRSFNGELVDILKAEQVRDGEQDNKQPENQ